MRRDRPVDGRVGAPLGVEVDVRSSRRLRRVRLVVALRAARADGRRAGGARAPARRTGDLRRGLAQRGLDPEVGQHVPRARGAARRPAARSQRAGHRLSLRRGRAQGPPSPAAVADEARRAPAAARRAHDAARADPGLDSPGGSRRSVARGLPGGTDAALARDRRRAGAHGRRRGRRRRRDRRRRDERARARGRHGARRPVVGRARVRAGGRAPPRRRAGVREGAGRLALVAAHPRVARPPRGRGRGDRPGTPRRRRPRRRRLPRRRGRERGRLRPAHQRRRRVPSRRLLDAARRGLAVREPRDVPVDARGRPRRGDEHDPRLRSVLLRGRRAVRRLRRPRHRRVAGLRLRQHGLPGRRSGVRRVRRARGPRAPRSDADQREPRRALRQQRGRAAGRHDGRAARDLALAAVRADAPGRLGRRPPRRAVLALDAFGRRAALHDGHGHRPLLRGRRVPAAARGRTHAPASASRPSASRSPTCPTPRSWTS